MQTALDTLAELNDWRWFSPDKDSVMLTRKRVRIPQTLADLPTCLISALPNDYRTFLGIGVAMKDLPENVIPTISGRPEVQPSFGPDLLVRENRLRTRMINLVRYQPQSLRKALLAELDDNKKAELDAGKK